MQPFDTRHSPGLLERVSLNFTLIQQVDEVILNIIQHFAIHLERVENPFIRVLEGYHRKIGRNLSPVRGFGAAMRRPEEDDEPASLSTGFRSVQGVLDDNSA